MGLLLRILITAVAAYFAARLVPGITIGDAKTAILVAIVLALLNAFLRPLLVLLTIPITIITLGLFLLVINIIIIYLAAYLVPGFEVSNWLAALIFSLVLAVLSFLLDAIF
jgi:putative membrane protein